jgi:hypothetical protein
MPGALIGYAPALLINKTSPRNASGWSSSASPRTESISITG